MSVYCGFRTRKQEDLYMQLTSKLIKLLNVRILKHINQESIDEFRFKVHFDKIYGKMSLLEESKYSDPKLSNSVQALANHLQLILPSNKTQSNMDDGIQSFYTLSGNQTRQRKQTNNIEEESFQSRKDLNRAQADLKIIYSQEEANLQIKIQNTSNILNYTTGIPLSKINVDRESLQLNGIVKAKKMLNFKSKIEQNESFDGILVNRMTKYLLDNPKLLIFKNGNRINKNNQSTSREQNYDKKEVKSRYQSLQLDSDPDYNLKPLYNKKASEDEEAISTNGYLKKVFKSKLKIPAIYNFTEFNNKFRNQSDSVQ